MNITNKKDLQNYLKENLLPMEEARKVTDQSLSSFNSAVASGRIVPFYQTESEAGRIQNKLYLKSELEEYKKNKRIRPNNFA